MAAAVTLSGCLQKGVTHKSYPLIPPLDVPFFTTAQNGAVTLYAGYGYNLSTLEFFAFDLEERSFVGRKKYKVEEVKEVCASSEGIVLSRLHGPLFVSFKAGTFVMKDALSSCPNPSVAIACMKGSTLFYGKLPGRQELLSICYNSNTRKTTFHITSEEGLSRNLGASGTSPGGEGRFVVTRGVHPGTFLAHHTLSAIRESAVLIDAVKGTVHPFKLPDLSQVRPSRGFGAGSFGVTLYPVHGGIVAEGEGGNVFLLKEGKTRQLTDHAVAKSVHIVTESCTLTLVARIDGGEEFRVYDLCDR